MSTSKEYEVLRIDEITRPGDLGGIELVYRHRIKTRGGMIKTVEVKEADFSPEKAGPILLEAAKNADAILKLG